MKKLKEKLLFTLIIAAFVAVIGGLWYGDYQIWRMVHPQAPTWTYFLSH